MISAQKTLLKEYLAPSVNRMVSESEMTSEGGKHYYMKGIFIEGDVVNANERIYPVREIERAVQQIRKQLEAGNSVMGEVDHPDDLKINIDRVSHIITDMWVDGPCGFGKLKILPTPMGDIISKMLGVGVKLGVSSRGSGNVDDATGRVSDFEIVTVDIVAQPSAPNAYPKAIYEGIMNMPHGHRLMEALKGDRSSAAVQRYLKDEVIRLIRDLKINKGK